MTRLGLVLVGVVTGAHGVKGEVKLRSFTANPAGIVAYNPLETEGGEQIEILKLRPQTDGFIALLKGIANRDAAEALKGAELFVPRERLAKTPEGEIYLHDLVSLTVWNGGKILGAVVNVSNYGAGDLLEVKVEDRKDTVLIPFAAGFVVSADVEGNKIAVDLPEGFLDDDIE